jgi:hypothetical protein
VIFDDDDDDSDNTATTRKFNATTTIETVTKTKLAENLWELSDIRNKIKSNERRVNVTSCGSESDVSM